MRAHLTVVRRRSIACKFTFVQKSRIIRCHLFRHATFHKSGRNVFLAELGHRHIHLVGYETDQGLVQFLIKSSREVLFQIGIGRLELPQGLFGGLSGLHSDCIAASGLNGPHHVPDNARKQQNQQVQRNKER